MTHATFEPTLFGGGDPAPDPAFTGARRLELDATSWVDLVPGWLAGADAWFTEIVDAAPWSRRQRRMCDRELLEPRLTCGWRLDEAPAPSGEIAVLLGGRYGMRFDRVSANHYRDGADSVAWHGDRVRFTATTTPARGRDHRTGRSDSSPSARGPRMRRSASSIRRSSMLASRRRMRPFSANSQFSLP